MALNKEKVMDAARKFVDKGQIDKAVKEYLRIVQEDPKDVRVWLKIGDLYAKKGAKQDAIETYLKVARFYHEQGFFLKAVAVYKQILKLDPRLVDVILRLAELYRQLGLMSDAMQHFESVAAHFHREGNTKEALATVRKLVDLDPENIATRIKLAELYSKEGLVQEAAQEFQIACDQLRRQNRQDDFLKVAERLLWHRPDYHALNRELAGLYLRRNDPRRALQKLQAAFKADPRDVETLGLLAQAFQALDQKAKTVSVLKELARIYVENKQRDNAAEVYRKILEFVPNDQDARDFVGAAAPPPRPATPAPPPPVRASTPLPPQVRAASHDAKFGLTGDLPAYSSSAPQNPGLTGSMPLIDEQSLSGVDFALPEYDDNDFSADMEPAPDPRAMSAAGEQHAEEISKILAETDVYVKYGLHQKAVDHLRRVFTLDPDNVEAHERLKDIFVSQNREQEAEVELLKLAEVVAPSDPDRAEAYLHELLAMNGTHTGAFDLARRFRLRVARMSSSSSEVEYAGGGGVAAIDPDLDDLSLDDIPRAQQRPMGIARHRDSVDDFDPDELIGGGQMAHGSPAPGRPPQPPTDYRGTGDGSFELDLGAYSAGAPPQVEDAEDLPFDPEEARRFDTGMPLEEQFALPTGPTQASLDPLAYDQAPDDGLSVSGSYDPYGTESVQTPPYGGGPHGHDTSVGGQAAPDDGLDDDQLAEQPRAETLHEDDLEEADFYLSQGLYPEAINALESLLARFPGHRLLLNKLRDVEAAMSGGQSSDEIPAEAIEQDLAAPSTDAIELDDIEEVGMDDLEELDPDAAVVPQQSTKTARAPQVRFERPIEDGDADTHYDLGLAYKEMGLHDEAIKAFIKALRAPGREVNCYVMIGLCHREQGNPNEAIHSFKQGLHAEPSERERQSIYYEIGVTYESIGDVGEAVYYFEMVYKRDPSFADVGARLEMLQAQGGRAQHQYSADDDL
ncbi:MAG: tetratricopeptide repeat protein [Kofleriaceae bacterium]|nr:tetratricopeptide repeat protein [Kofleriaceae bacterium]